MVVVTLTMHARSEKRRELLQTLYELLPLLSKEQGCRDVRVYMDAENINHLILVEEWDTQQDVERHMQSNYCDVLRGAMQILTNSSEIRFSPVSHIAHMEPILTGQCQECGNMNACRVPVCPGA